MRKIILVFIGFIICHNISSQELSGVWGYNIDGNSINLYGGEVVNNNYGGTSGTLKIALYASYSQYYGGSITGYSLFEMNLGELSGGYSFNNISDYGSISRPPSGVYFMTILLLEYSYSGYEIIDYLSMDSFGTF